MIEWDVFLFIQIAATWMMVGMIWFMQIVHYPLYKRIKDGFVEYERSHIKRTACFIGPVMIIEAVSAIFLVGIAPGDILSKLATVNIILLIFIWLSTFTFQMYQHQKLSIRFSKRFFHLLIASNWLRTILWSLKGMTVLFMIYY